MATGTVVLTSKFEHGADALLRSGRWIFAFASVALGAENLVCAHVSQQPLGAGYAGIPVLPWVPAMPWLAMLTGAIAIACGVGLLLRRWAKVSGFALGALLVGATLVFVLPKYIALPGDMGLRTVVFEPLSLACIAFLWPGEPLTPVWLARTSRWLFAVAMIVFGVDHFLALAPIGTLLPDWIPWHVFWIGFFGAVFIVAGMGIGLRILERWSWAAIGLMFAVFVLTLHVERTLGFYSIPGAIRDPDEWSSLFIAVGLWGGPWAMAAQASGGKR